MSIVAASVSQCVLWCPQVLLSLYFKNARWRGRTAAVWFTILCLKQSAQPLSYVPQGAPGTLFLICHSAERFLLHPHAEGSHTITRGHKLVGGHILLQVHSNRAHHKGSPSSEATVGQSPWGKPEMEAIIYTQGYWCFWQTYTSAS